MRDFFQSEFWLVATGIVLVVVAFLGFASAYRLGLNEGIGRGCEYTEEP